MKTEGRQVRQSNRYSIKKGVTNTKKHIKIHVFKFLLKFFSFKLKYGYFNSVPGIQQNDSVIYIYILFRYRLLKDIEYISLCYTVGLYCSSIL